MVSNYQQWVQSCREQIKFIFVKYHLWQEIVGTGINGKY